MTSLDLWPTTQGIPATFTGSDVEVLIHVNPRFGPWRQQPSVLALTFSASSMFIKFQLFSMIFIHFIYFIHSPEPPPKSKQL